MQNTTTRHGDEKGFYYWGVAHLYKSLSGHTGLDKLSASNHIRLDTYRTGQGSLPGLPAMNALEICGRYLLQKRRETFRSEEYGCSKSTIQNIFLRYAAAATIAADNYYCRTDAPMADRAQSSEVLSFPLQSKRNILALLPRASRRCHLTGGRPFQVLQSRTSDALIASLPF